MPPGFRGTQVVGGELLTERPSVECGPLPAGPAEVSDPAQGHEVRSGPPHQKSGVHSQNLVLSPNLISGNEDIFEWINE